MDTFSWKPALIGLVFSIMGAQDIISQGFIMPKLLTKLSDKQIAVLGMVSEIIGYSLIALSALFSFYPLFIAGMFIFGFGDSIFGPSFNGMLSKSVDSSEQGRIQGEPIYSGFSKNDWACHRRSNLCITWVCRTRFYGYDPYSSGNTSFI